MAVIVNQNPENEQEQPTQGNTLQTIGTASPAGQEPGGTPQARSMANTLNQQQQRQGSGRFTNIQRYLQANQGAGQRIASQIGQNIGQNLQQQQQKAQDYYSKFGRAAEQAQQTAQQGVGFQQQLGQIGQQIQQVTLTPEQLADQELAQQQLANRQQQNLNAIESFTQDPNFQKFQEIQAGRGINEQLLALQQQRAYQQAQEAQQTAQQAQQQLGSESGRFELLRQSFGGGNRPGYTTGQQRLDQLLLGRSNDLGQVQSDVATKARELQQQAKEAGQAGQTVNTLAEQERSLLESIAKQSQGNEEAYMNMLRSYIDPTNIQRKQEFEGLGSAIGTYVPEYNPETQKYTQKAYSPGFTTEQMKNLGVEGAQGVYNVFKDEAFTKTAGETPEERNYNLAKVLAEEGRRAQTAQDIANEQDVARYNALRKIMGATEPGQITKVSDIGAAYIAKTGDAGLKERLASAQKQFDDIAKQNLIKSHYASKDSVYATPEQLINQGRNALIAKDRSSGETWKYNDLVNDPYGRYSYYGGMASNVINQLQNLINEQNYNRTLGGRRETFLDTEAANKAKELGITPKLDPTPITETDPSLQYPSLTRLLTDE